MMREKLYASQIPNSMMAEIATMDLDDNKALFFIGKYDAINQTAKTSMLIRRFKRIKGFDRMNKIKIRQDGSGNPDKYIRIS